jgi:hypothetical protein
MPIGCALTFLDEGLSFAAFRDAKSLREPKACASQEKARRKAGLRSHSFVQKLVD